MREQNPSCLAHVVREGGLRGMIRSMRGGGNDSIDLDVVCEGNTSAAILIRRK